MTNNKSSTLKEDINFDNVYYCNQCKRFTDVNYIRDKIDKTQRHKSYCYFCDVEFPLERVSDVICKTQESDNKIIAEMVKENEDKFRQIQELQSEIKENDKEIGNLTTQLIVEHQKVLEFQSKIKKFEKREQELLLQKGEATKEQIKLIVEKIKSETIKQVEEIIKNMEKKRITDNNDYISIPMEVWDNSKQQLKRL